MGPHVSEHLGWPKLLTLPLPAFVHPPIASLFGGDLEEFVCWRGGFRLPTPLLLLWHNVVVEQRKIKIVACQEL